MGLVRKFTEYIGKEFRSSLENPQSPLSFPAEWLLDIFQGGRTDSGMRISEMTALQSVAVRTCVEVIARGISTVFATLAVNEGIEKAHGRMARRIATEHNLFNVLTKAPNDEMTAVIFWQALMCCALLWSNGYAEIQRDAVGRPVALWPRQPHKTRPLRVIAKEGIVIPEIGMRLAWNDLFYVTTDGINEADNTELGAQGYRAQRIIAKEDMIHIKGLTLDGRLGSSVIQDARQTIGLALALEKYGAKFFGNGARASYVIEVPGNIDDIQKELLRRSFQESQGGENMLRPIVLTAGMKATPLTLKNDEAQFKESRMMQDTQIAALFHVPPHMIGQMEKSNRSNLEQVSQEFVQYCLGPWLIQLKQELECKLLPTVGRSAGKYFLDTKPPISVMTDLFRPSSADMEKYMSTRFNTGSASPNDLLEMNGLNPVDEDGMDDYYVPVNVQKVSDPVVTPPEPGAQGAGGAGGQEKPPAKPAAKPAPKPETKSLIKAHSGLFADAFQRIQTRKNPHKAAFERTFLPVFVAMADLAQQFTDPEFRSGKPLPADLVKFVKDYIGGMAKRSSKWTEKDMAPEFERATRAIFVAVAKDIAGQRALEGFVGPGTSLDFVPVTDNQQDPDLDRLYLVEHGRTDYSASGKMHGNHDISLNDDGRADADKAADWFKKHANNVRKIVSSDLKRARETADAIGKHLNVVVSVDQSLRPWRIGEFSGQTPDYKDSKGNDFQHYIDHPDEIIPLGESFNVFIERYIRAFRTYLSEAEQPGTVVLVCHSFNVVAACNWVTTGKAIGPTSLNDKKKATTGGRVVCIEADPNDRKKFIVEDEDTSDGAEPHDDIEAVAQGEL
jgi:HK97 family phage portal protein